MKVLLVEDNERVARFITRGLGETGHTVDHANNGRDGLFLAASGFPKNRETRAPLVLELIPHKDEIDPKYHFLLDAPAKDPEGRPAVIRYSRKTKEQYVQSEVDGKPTGWRAFFDGGKWKVEDKR